MLKCHKVVLSACSPYFQTLLAENPSTHPIVILRDISWVDLKHIVEYMYKGEIRVNQEELPNVLKAAEALKVRGLLEVGARKNFSLGLFDEMEITEGSPNTPLLVEFDADEIEPVR